MTRTDHDETTGEEETSTAVRKATWARDGSTVDIAIVKASRDSASDTEDIKGRHDLVFP